jgi:hypothetical protein
MRNNSTDRTYDKKPRGCSQPGGVRVPIAKKTVPRAGCFDGAPDGLVGLGSAAYDPTRQSDDPTRQGDDKTHKSDDPTRKRG